MTEIQIPADQPNKHRSAVVQIGSANVPVWPGALARLFDPYICAAHFADPPVYGGLVSRIVEESTKQAENVQGLGGKKVRDAQTWQLPAAELLTRRALLFFCEVYDIREAHVVDRWANVSRQHEYNAPHSHYDSQYSIVYFLDLGDEDPSLPISGRFELIDSRIAFCCSKRPHFPTRGILPTLVPGLMFGFPAEFLHHAHPYLGQRPRITLVWNVNPGLPPQGHEFDPTAPVLGDLGATPEPGG